MASSLPNDIIFSCILSKLPAKSVVRFKCVSKSFLTEIMSTNFIKLHHLNALSSNANRLLILPAENMTLSIFELDSLHSPPTVLPYPIPQDPYLPSRLIVASCESYVLLASPYVQLQYDLALLNPTTRIYHILPEYINSTANFIAYGMCHCSDEYDDLKIVKFLYEDRKDKMEIKVYSLKTNLWKPIECDSKVISSSSYRPVLLQNHLLHLIIYENGHQQVPRIGCFDMKDERWSRDVPLSENLLFEIGLIPFQRDKPFYSVSELDGQLCFSFYISIIKSNYDLWIMKEYGVKESWIKLMSVSFFDCQEYAKLWEGVYYPLAYYKGYYSDDQVLCIRNNGKCFRYNIRDKNAIEIDFHDNHNSSYTSYSFGYICKGSLLNFPGAQSIDSYIQQVDDDATVIDGQ